MPLRPSPSLDVHLTPSDLRAQLEHDVRVGLTASQKWIPATWFYDDEGCRLFDEITRLPEYYPTRTERSILTGAAGELAAIARPRTMVELGSGTSEKTTLLIDACIDEGSLTRFVPFDVAEATLLDAMARLDDRYDLDLHGVVGDFRRHLGDLFAATAGDGPRLVVFLGGTIGNLNETERHSFFREVADAFGPGDALLLGTDTVKDRARLVRAYDDAAGVTAAFNRNVLTVVNRELDGDLDPMRFDHVARFDETHQRIEMVLRARERHHADLIGLDLGVRFEEGEDLLTEISCKFTGPRLREEVELAGLAVAGAWTDPAGDFLVTLLQLG
ncbi:MAG TPA: L-histidine N(alpha)-methyltransferase [Microthrixaceae bacterium]|nr:L-histidine N(alpha)-methyltransferase [Microthrixaceae bacterium]